MSSCSSITWIITGGTISRVGAEKNRKFDNSFAQSFLHDARLNVDIKTIDFCAKFSEEIGDSEINQIVQIIQKNSEKLYLITCGTDAMISIANKIGEKLGNIKAKIIFTGAFIPYRHPHSDAKMNLMSSIIYLRSFESFARKNRKKIRICMHGELFDPLHVKKDKLQKRFVITP